MSGVKRRQVRWVPIKEDFVSAECGSRVRCAVNLGLRRTLKLSAEDRPQMDANSFRYIDPATGERVVLHTPIAAIRLLRRFDELGERHGQDQAREMSWREYTDSSKRSRKLALVFDEIKREPQRPKKVRSPEQAVRDNELRQARRTLYGRGSSYRRYVGT
jgi:hypothetical protein